MQWGKFEPLPPTKEDIDKRQEIYNERHRRIKQYADDNNLTKLVCDYYGMNFYYYNVKTKQLYKVCSLGDSNPKFVLDNDEHILRLNNLPIIDNTKNITGFSW